MNSIAKKVHIGLDLLLDYNSLLFSLLRTFLSSRKNIHLTSSHRKFVEMNGPIKAMENIKNSDSKISCLIDSKTKETWEEYFYQNLGTIKPQIGVFNTRNIF